MCLEEFFYIIDSIIPKCRRFLLNDVKPSRANAFKFGEKESVDRGTELSPAMSLLITPCFTFPVRLDTSTKRVCKVMLGSASLLTESGSSSDDLAALWQIIVYVELAHAHPSEKSGPEVVLDLSNNGFPGFPGPSRLCVESGASWACCSERGSRVNSVTMQAA
eukprot:CAMPEP_0184646226 /NCGR_PEP_ID=MMETSP0308-20130426/2878_1 /TAXON_ID=38269 /ORGANISM="Gloeochaete witrockiana, Strain SAG 46.84" /LENGTH=162 /DNA_ID=CAMNT_0027076029 /DNA_START=269 /DNA_END=758 /DNA_ORIENTATION=-